MKLNFKKKHLHSVPAAPPPPPSLSFTISCFSRMSESIEKFKNNIHTLIRENINVHSNQSLNAREKVFVVDVNVEC